ncbi:hypothetical protein EGR_08949 [Echinococcus granulosus]|uniref:Uncharacterized protein n=1 Tax=Echinococcus granulosus TaxID=6210 RepID=W6U752_ECHGR|nr:hypothetical protein EGR_08949 [Echinococcus granulosus]EUB56201.1 hypothetical protein EGR_08949 [Echinococcus granulosus]
MNTKNYHVDHVRAEKDIFNECGAVKYFALEIGRVEKINKLRLYRISIICFVGRQKFDSESIASKQFQIQFYRVCLKEFYRQRHLKFRTIVKPQTDCGVKLGPKNVIPFLYENLTTLISKKCLRCCISNSKTEASNKAKITIQFGYWQHLHNKISNCHENSKKEASQYKKKMKPKIRAHLLTHEEGKCWSVV